MHDDEVVRLRQSIGTSRRTAQCVECGEVAPLATREECFTCYRRRRREQQRPLVDRHTPGIPRDHKKLLTAHGKLLGALADLKVNRWDVHAILGIITPYVDPVREWLVPGERERSENVHVHNSDEQATSDVFQEDQLGRPATEPLPEMDLA